MPYNAKKERAYTVGSLFAGIGGICRGFQQAGFEISWANEFDKHACITYRANFGHSLVEEDIHKLNPNDFKRVDIITSGFPCQAFSIAGYQKGFTDHRGNLFFETMRFINVLRPKAFLLENVRNLMGHDKGSTFNVIKEYILRSGYSCIPKVLNSMEYGNVPQTRERIYIVGFRDEAGYREMDRKHICSSIFKFPDPIPLTRKPQNLLTDDVGRKYSYSRFSRTNRTMYNSLFREITEDVIEDDSVYQWRRVYVRKNKSNVCPTLTANMGTGGHNVPLVRINGDIRKLTPRECARFQGLDDDFVLPNTLPDSQLYKQIGNSVTVPVIKRTAEQIKIALNARYIHKKTRKRQPVYA